MKDYATHCMILSAPGNKLCNSLLRGPPNNSIDGRLRAINKVLGGDFAFNCLKGGGGEGVI